DGLMLAGMRSRFRRTVHTCLPYSLDRQARYRKIDIVVGLVPDVLEVVSDIAHIARIKSRPLHLRRISAFRPPASWRVSSRGCP
ncbi:hypothetical protein LR032_03345, partial [Candidatus Bipolaricaulota bacterium]|nr:hypothetical protein [Candidatus Bipolaricaulota bacterium]